MATEKEYAITLNGEEISVTLLCLSSDQERCTYGSEDWQFFEDLMDKFREAEEV